MELSFSQLMFLPFLGTILGPKRLKCWVQSLLKGTPALTSHRFIHLIDLKYDYNSFSLSPIRGSILYKGYSVK